MRPHVGRRGESGRGRDYQRPAGGATVAGLVGALLLLAVVACGLPSSPLALGWAYAAPFPAAPTDSPTSSGTPSATATATPTPTPPTLTLLSPTAKRGPSGANVTIAGANFSGAQAKIFASPQATCDTQLATLGFATTSGGGFTAYTFVWPTTLPVGQYYVCGEGMTANAPTFYEVTSAPPTLALSTAAIQPGQPVTISGSNFFGAKTIDVTLHAGSTVHDIQRGVAPGGDGTFSIQYIPDGSLTGGVVIVAASPLENSAPTPALQASVYLNVLPGSTATVDVTPSPQSTQAISGPVPPNKNTGDNTGLVLALIAAVIIGLLIVLGVVAFFILRGRSGGNPALGHPGGPAGPGGYGGYTSGVPTAYGRQTGRPGGLEPEADSAYGQGLNVGAVAQWEDEPRPGPDWQPRPMSGRPSYEETPLPEYGDEYPTDASRYAEAGGYEPDDHRPETAPPDPWADPAEVDGLYGGRGATNPANYPDEEWTQVQPRLRQPDQIDWHNDPGPGMTRPDNTAEEGAGVAERGSTAEDTAGTEIHEEA